MSSEKLDVVNVRLVNAPSLYSSTPIETPQDVVNLVAEEFKTYDREVFAVINLKSNGQPINLNVCSVGTLSGAFVSPREVFKSTILSNAAAFIAVHNHPSGNVFPSEEDRETTERLAACGKLLGIQMLDSVIIGGESGKVFSMMAAEMMPTEFENAQELLGFGGVREPMRYESSENIYLFQSESILDQKSEYEDEDDEKRLVPAELLPGYVWTRYDDGSGSLSNEKGEKVLSYDLLTKEYWDQNDKMYLYKGKGSASFFEFAEKIVNASVKDSVFTEFKPPEYIIDDKQEIFLVVDRVVSPSNKTTENLLLRRTSDKKFTIASMPVTEEKEADADADNVRPYEVLEWDDKAQGFFSSDPPTVLPYTLNLENAFFYENDATGRKQAFGDFKDLKEEFSFTMEKIPNPKNKIPSFASFMHQRSLSSSNMLPTADFTLSNPEPEK